MTKQLLPINMGELFDVNKRFPVALGRISFMKMFAYGRVVNIGCYEGKMFGDKVTNVDLYDFGAPNLTIANAEKLPFKDKEFDCAIVSEVLEHVDDPVKVLKEAMRVADSVALSVPNEYEFSPEMRPFENAQFTASGIIKAIIQGGNYIPKSPGYGPTTSGAHVRYFNQEKLYALLKEVDFPLIYFAKINLGGWSALIAFGSSKQMIELGHRMAGTRDDPRKGQNTLLTHCETIALIPFEG